MSEHDKGKQRRVLILANETVEGVELLDAIRTGDGGKATEVLVVAPALNSRLRHWVSDEDRARRDAALRLGAYLQELVVMESRQTVGSEMPTRSCRSPTRCIGSRSTRSSLPPIPNEARTGWPGTSSAGRAGSFPSRSTTSSSKEPPGKTWPWRNVKTGVRHLVLSSRKRAECGTFRPHVGWG